PTLFDAIQKAKKNSVPNDNIDRAVKRGSGAEAGGAEYQTVMYEGYGPSGVAILIECLTDNRNRAATEVRVALTRNHGTLADAGSVAYMFSRKGVVLVAKAAGLTEDDLLLAVLDAGAEECNDLGERLDADDIDNVSAYVTQAVRGRMRAEQTRNVLTRLGFNLPDEGVARMRQRLRDLEAMATPEERAEADRRFLEKWDKRQE